MKKWLLTLGMVMLIMCTGVFAEDKSADTSWNNEAGIRQREHGQKHARWMNDDHEMMDRMKQFMNEMEKYSPGIQDLLRQLREESATRYRHKRRRLLQQIFSDMPMLGRIAHGDPELKELMAEYIKLELESLVLANEIRDEKNQDEKEELSDELNEVLEKAFDKKVTLKTKGLEHLEQKLKETREELQSRKDNKEAIIKNRYDVLTGSETSLEW